MTDEDKDEIRRILSNIQNNIDFLNRKIVITGQKGQGKTELAKYINKKLEYPLVEFGIKIDEIREMIESIKYEVE